MSIIVAIANLIFVCFISYRLSKQALTLQGVFWPALALKLIAGIALGLLYTYHYTIADTFVFFKDGTVLSSMARRDFASYLKFLWNGNESYSFWTHLNFTQPRALFLTKIVSFFCLLTNDNYWIISIYFSLASFACSWKLVNVMVGFFPVLKVEVLLAFLFIPSVVFWGSGLMKECLAIGSLFYLTSIFLKIWFQKRIPFGEVSLGLIALWLLWQLKYYYAGVFLPVVITTLVVRRIILPLLKIKSGPAEVLLWFAILILPLVGISLLKENFHPDTLMHVVVRNYGEFQTLSDEGDAINFQGLQPSMISFLYYSPKALFSGLFRPFVGEASNILQVFSAIENLFIFILFIGSLWNLKFIFATPNRLLIVSIITYVILLCVFLTLSTPNFGTLSRYRIGFLPFLIFLLSINNPLIHYLYNLIQRLFAHFVR